MSSPPYAFAGRKLDAGRLGFLAAWRPAEPLWRIYSQAYGPAGFNDSDHGYARFSPLRRPDGTVVPVLYAGSTLDVALMEGVLRDVPNPSAGYHLTMPAPGDEPRRATQIMLDRPLRMADFSSVGLRSLDLSRSDVVDTGSSEYPATQALAAWVYARTQTARAEDAVQGIVWTSRQDDSGQAAVIFGDRIGAGTLAPLDSGQGLLAGRVGTALTLLAERLGVFIVTD